MIIAFTICSNNYLAQAAVLTNSIKKTNPECHVIVGLVDKKELSIDYTLLNADIIEIDQIGIPNFADLWQKYDIVELNTSVKASMFKYLFYTYQSCTAAYYFDPDIQLFEHLGEMNSLLDIYDVLLTPHVLTIVPLDGQSPEENTFLNYGIYNLGFIGLKSNNLSKEVFELLNWWEERLLKYCFNRPCDGYFVDQLWLNLVPIYFNKVKILLEMGYNAGPWNLHERQNLSCREDNRYVMPDQSKLFFYHFSNYKPADKFNIARYYNRVDMKNHQGLLSLYGQYWELLNTYNVGSFAGLKCYYVRKRNQYLKEKEEEIKRINKNMRFREIVKLLVPPLIIKIIKRNGK